ncbi:MAG: SAP domain-containing protein [Anaerolineae bacterium]
MPTPDVSGYFHDFGLNSAQLKRLAKLVEGVHRLWGVEYGDSVSLATLVVAPGALPSLTPGAVDLLQRCHERVRAFAVRLDRQYDPFHKETYQELFDLLISHGLVEDGSPVAKLSGSTTVQELRTMLRALGLSSKGNKEELVARYASSISADALEALISGVVLYRTTPEGQCALTTIESIRTKMARAFDQAVSATSGYYEAHTTPSPALPAGLLYDDGDVRITEDDVDAAMAAFDSVVGSGSSTRQERRVVLIPQEIDTIISEIEAQGDGFFVIAASLDDDSEFVQGSYLGSGHQPVWRFEVSKGVRQGDALGFTLSPGDILAHKGLSADVASTLFRTVIIALGVETGDPVYVTFDR